MEIKVGDIVRTPFEPRGKVRILHIFAVRECDEEDAVAFVDVEYLHDHAGMAKGARGRYFLQELEEANGYDQA